MMIANRTSDRDQQLLDRAQALLKEHLPEGASLTRAEVQPGLQESEGGYLYLRYDVPTGTPQEFWAHWGHRNTVGEKSGQVSVKMA